MMVSVIRAHMSQSSSGLEILRAKSRHRFWPLGPKVCQDEEEIKGKVVIVTGCNTGIGKETVLHLARRGPHIIMACRDLGKAQKALEDIQLILPDSKLETMKLDLGDLQSVRDFVKEFQAKYDKLDILINNAGYYDTSRGRKINKDGFEAHMGINHLGPFLLTRLLVDTLKKSGGSRVVCVNSGLMVASSLDLDDLMMEKPHPDPEDNNPNPYGRSKLANYVCMKRLVKEELEGSGVKLFQLNPGLVVTDIGRYTEGFFNKILLKLQFGLIGLNVTKGCETVVLCSVSKSVAENGGRGELHQFCQVLEYGEKIISMEDAKVKRLYEMSERLVGLGME